ncbi:MAG: DUF1540 domain-containing protein [Clostridia bacterium]|nr:DUF1540 domain-containing protein [Clostridia bacterium]
MHFQSNQNSSNPSNIPLKGVCCHAINCHYHAPEDMCTAGMIVIDGESATRSDSTLCQTFKSHA